MISLMESFNCLNQECILLLHRNSLLRPLIKAELIKTELKKISLEKDLEKNTISDFFKRLGVNDEDKYQEWLINNNLNRSDVEELALKPVKIKKLCKQEFGHKVEARFLERKNKLDVVIYSLIRTKDPFKAQELYLRIIENEADFSDLASIYSEGIEKKTRGIIGPVTVEKSHPIMQEILRTSEPGKTNKPVKIEDSYVVVRVESYDPARLDDFMKEKMREELFNDLIESKVNDINQLLLEQSRQVSNKGSVL